MAKGSFVDRLRQRCARSDAQLPAEAVEMLTQYFDLLAKWNARINLTALTLTPPSDEAIDRLFVEPLAAVPHFPSDVVSWFDLGSGGGSPALPARIVRPAGALTLIEAKARKAAFLREAVRLLRLSHVNVENRRFEEVADANPGMGQLVTVRAVRADMAMAESAAELLGFEGRLLLFGSSAKAPRLPEFEPLQTVPLIKDASSFLSIYRRIVPRGTRRR